MTNGERSDEPDDSAGRAPYRRAVSSESRAERRFRVRFGQPNVGERVLEALGLGGFDFVGLTSFGSSNPSGALGVVEVVDRFDDRIVWRLRDDIEVVRELHDQISRVLIAVSAEAFAAEWDLSSSRR